MKNRIKAHRKVRVGDLVPHELNPRRHGEEQREALRALLGEVGFARSLLAYELPDGRLKLIDGHLRQSELDPDESIEVEILDVDDAEARKLLLSIDPLAQLAAVDASRLEELRQATHADSEILNAFWASLERQERAVRTDLETLERERPRIAEPGEQFLIIIACADEQQQLRLLARFRDEGLNVSAKTA